MAELKVPLIAVVIGEGGSGGALAIAMGDRIGMLSNAYVPFRPGWSNRLQ